jgi:hypothetical protein
MAYSIGAESTTRRAQFIIYKCELVLYGMYFLALRWTSTMDASNSVTTNGSASGPWICMIVAPFSHMYLFVNRKINHSVYGLA